MGASINPTRLTAIEASRGLAASAVIFYHAARHLNKVYGVQPVMSFFQFGHTGVDLFFVISGFIILFVHYDDIGRPERIRRYLWRRFSRIMPVYWVALALTILLSLAGGHPAPSIFRVLWSSTLLPSYQWPLLDVAWTLQFEIIFYAAFCVLILNRSAGLLTLCCWIIWIVLEKVYSPAGAGLPASLYGAYNIEFFFGMAVAYWLKGHQLRNPGIILTIGAASFFAAAAAEYAHLIDGYASSSRLIYGLAAAIIVLGAAECSRRAIITVPTALQVLGTASYSIYLFQFIFIGALWKFWLAAGLDTKLPHLASFPLLVSFAIVGGVVTSRLVEYPLMRMMRRPRLTTKAIPGRT